jgi:KUP system potassium uptake protein
VPEVLRLVETAEIKCRIEADTRRISYPRSGCAVAPRQPMAARWRQRLFLATSAITADTAEWFNLPRNRTVIVGSHIEV